MSKAHLIELAQRELNDRTAAANREAELKARTTRMNSELVNELKARVPNWEAKHPNVCTVGDTMFFFRLNPDLSCRITFDVAKGVFFISSKNDMAAVNRHHNVHASVVVDTLIEVLIPEASKGWLEEYLRKAQNAKT